MALVINSNIQSLNAQRNLNSAQMEQNDARERLSSGKRINSAADDAAGLAISNRMTSQINGLNQAVRNANDGVSMIQTAEGALDESTNILQRMRELSIQSANGTYDSGNRASMNAEVEQLKAELTRIAETTSFNGQNILDGSLGKVSLQVGSEANQSIDINLQSGFRANELGEKTGGVSSGKFTLAQTTAASQSGAPGSLKALSAGDLIINGTAIPAAQTSSDTKSSSDNAASAISLAKAINSQSSKTGVVAEANATSINMGTASGFANLTGGDLTINGTQITGTVTNAATLAEAINKNSSATGVVATFTGSDFTLTAADGRNIQLQTDGAGGTTFGNFSLVGGAANQTTSSTVSLRSNEAIDIKGNDPAAVGLTSGAVAGSTTAALQKTAGSAATMTLAVTSTATATQTSFTLNGETITYTGANGTALADTTASVNAMIAAINLKSGETGVTAALDGAYSATNTNIKLTAGVGAGINIATSGATANADTVNITASSGGGATPSGLFGGANSSTAADTNTANTFSNLANGDLTVNGFTVDFAGTTASPSSEKSTVDGNASAMHIAAAINNTAGLKDQVNATARTEMNLGAVSAGTADATFSLVVNGRTIDIDNSIKEKDSDGTLVAQLNAAFADAFTADNNSDAGGLVASTNDKGELLITANDGRNITVSVGGTNGDKLFGNIDVTEAGSVTAKGTVSLTALAGHSVGEIGGERRSLAGIEAGKDTIADINISTAAGAQEAIKTIDRALEEINSARGELGAVNNRLDFTVKNLSNVSENASAARSRILDADFAAESANLSRAQVLQQAGSAMLAQANAAPQQVLSLLQ